MVSAWAVENHLTLGQVATDAKSNEITAIPELLKLLDLEGAVVTIDAMGCQKDIAAGIVQREGEYVLAVKENQPHLYEDIQQAFEEALEHGEPGVDFTECHTEEIQSGRQETRTCCVITEPAAEFGDFSLISTTISGDSSCSLSGMRLCRPTLDRFLGLGLLDFGRCPMAPDFVEFQDHEPDQRSPPPPLVPHLLQEAEHPVGPLHMIVGPHPLAQRVSQVRHQLGELLLIPVASIALTNSGTAWNAGSRTTAARRQLAWWKSLDASNTQ